MQVDQKFLEKILVDIDILIIPGGSYGKWSNSKSEEKIAKWLNEGGKIIALSSALDLFANTDNFGENTAVITYTLFVVGCVGQLMGNVISAQQSLFPQVSTGRT